MPWCLRKADAHPSVFGTFSQAARAQELGADRRRESLILGLGKVFEFICMFFPVVAVEFRGVDAVDGGGVQTPDVDADSVGVGARDVKGLDAADPARMVFRDPSIKGIGGEVLLTR